MLVNLTELAEESLYPFYTMRFKDKLLKILLYNNL